MNHEINKPANPNGHGKYERQDLRVTGILYFLLGIVVVTAICLFALNGIYGFLDRREKALQPAVNPLLTHVPPDTRSVAPGYPQSTFPNPKLEEDERGQLNDIRMNEEKVLYSYGWIDEKSGILHIPIERAMDLIVQRGLPVRPRGGASESPDAKAERNSSHSGKAQSAVKAKKK